MSLYTKMYTTNKFFFLPTNEKYPQPNIQEVKVLYRPICICDLLKMFSRVHIKFNVSKVAVTKTWQTVPLRKSVGKLKRLKAGFGELNWQSFLLTWRLFFPSVDCNFFPTAKTVYQLFQYFMLLS